MKWVLGKMSEGRGDRVLGMSEGRGERVLGIMSEGRGRGY